MNGKKNIFIVGLDDFNKKFLSQMTGSGGYEFHGALHYSDIREVKSYNMKALIDKAISKMESFRGSVDGVAAYYDFPGTSLVPILAKRFNLPGPKMESVMKCEHKYWSRLEQKKVIPEHIPKFQAFDPFDEQAFEKLELLPPFWIKPIKSFKSFLSFRINDEQEFREAVSEIRKKIGLICEPFQNFVKDYSDIPGELSLNETCIAESPIGGFQFTLEGYCFKGESVIYGIVDSIREKDDTTFARYQYPSNLPLEIEVKLADITRKIVNQIELDNSPFNIEFYYNQTSDQIYLLEINPRVSEAHSDMFAKVHGHSHLRIMADICLGKKPQTMRKDGSFKMAAHFMLRHFEDGWVTYAPGAEQIMMVEEMYPETKVKILVREGERLSELLAVQNSYSYELANIFIGGRDEEELVEKYNDILELLPFTIEKEPVSDDFTAGRSQEIQGIRNPL